MPENAEHLGLCSTCRNAPGCAFPGCPDNVVFHCEEFDCRENSSTKSATKARSPTDFSYNREGNPPAEFNGLCSDCENCQDCKFPRPEGGVWHCEEYR